MNEDLDQQILTELRRMRRSSELASLVVIIAVATVIAFSLWVRLQSPGTLHRSPSAETDSWSSVRSALDYRDYAKADGIAQRLVAAHPDDYYGYSFLGTIALGSGRLKEAESDYARADELLPSEENDKMLQAIRKRLAKESAAHAPAP